MSQSVYTLEFQDESQEEQDRIRKIMDNLSWDKQIFVGHPEKGIWKHCLFCCNDLVHESPNFSENVSGGTSNA